MKQLKSTTFSQRSEIYGDIYELISPGFLSQKVTILGNSFVLRSLMPRDSFLLKYRLDSKSLRSLKTWTVAASLWMINGINLLPNSHNDHEIYELVELLPYKIVNTLYLHCVRLYDRVSKALFLSDAFFYEDVSRSLWKQIHRNFGAESGIPGADSLGLNYIQKKFIAYNELEDLRYELKNQWEGFKLVARTNQPDAIKKLSEAEERQDEQRHNQKLARMDLYYYYVNQIISDAEFNSYLEGVTPQYYAQKSDEDLIDEYKNWVTGVKDDHDLVVDSYKQRILDEKIRVEDMYRQYREALKSQEASQPNFTPKLVAYTPDQLDSILKDRQQGRPEVKTIISSQNDYLDIYLDPKNYKMPDEMKIIDGKIVDTKFRDDVPPTTKTSLMDSLNKRTVKISD